MKHDVAHRPWARFDNLRSGTATVFPAADRTIIATESEQVAPALQEVSRLTAAGAWAFGFVSYEAAAGLDSALPVHPPMPGLPLVWFGVCAAPIPVPVIGHAAAGEYDTGPWHAAWNTAQHRAAVAVVHNHIAAGDTYQVNVTCRLTADFSGDPLGLYAHLAHAQRGAHHAYLDTGRSVIASASPELFFDISGNRIRMRPMKGTAPRGRTAAEDDQLLQALRASAKERAENLMIVDLVRNDLGRVATVGSVRVTSLFRHERYETVHQLTSEVTAELVPRVGLPEVFRALFPCGSVTGAPKRSAMEIIRTIEPDPRGVYCGAIGIVGPRTARFSVAIRTALIDQITGLCSYGAGGGITWDSDSDSEYQELISKTRILPAQRSDVHTTCCCAGRSI